MKIYRALHALFAVPPRVCLRDTIGDTGVDADVGWGRRWRWNGGSARGFRWSISEPWGGERPGADTLASRLALSSQSRPVSASRSVGR